MSYERLAARLYGVPLLITPEKAQIIERVFRAHLDGTVAALAPFKPSERSDILTQTAMTFTRQRAGYLRSDAGTALIQVVGTLVQRSSGMDALSGMESYDNIGAQLQAALADPMVRGILIEFDSPGGEGNGVAGLADAIRAADEQKPVVAHANEFAFSAAYWLASAAGEVYVPKTGMVGSVGVLMLHVDQSRMNDKRGLDVTHITAGARKADFSPHQPLSDAALANAQAMVDRLYGQFVKDVAQSRGMTQRAVRETEAGLLNPDEASANGMIDGIETLDGALQRLHVLMSDPKQRRSYGRAAAIAQLSEEHDMTQAATGAAPVPAVITQEQLDAAKAAGIAEGKAAAKTEAEAAAKKDAEANVAKAATERIKAITTCEAAKTRAALAAHLAFETDMNAEAAQAVLAKAAPEAKPNTLAANMPPNPNIGADGEPRQGAGAATLETSEQIFARRRAQVRSVK